jgi:hypothetical protein
VVARTPALSAGEARQARTILARERSPAPREHHTYLRERDPR